MILEHVYREITDGIEVTVKPELVVDQSNSDLGYYFYKYDIQIRNHSDHSHQIMSRHWIVRDGKGNEEEVIGEGLLGEQPKLEPGESYTYSSACPLTTPTGNMRGKYYSVDETGKEHSVSIPLFFLRPPNPFQDQTQEH